MQTASSSRLRLLFATLFSLWWMTSPTGLALADFSSPAQSETVILVAPGTVSEIVTFPANSVMVNFEEPLHGTLVHTSQGIEYHPNPSFWEVGQDATLIEFAHTSSIGLFSTERYTFTASALSLENNNVFVNSPQPPNVTSLPWEKHHAGINKVIEVPGIVADIAYQMTVDNDMGGQPSLTVPDDGSAGNQGTTEHDIDVSIDDLGVIDPTTTVSDEFSFYRVSQNGQTIIEINAFYDGTVGAWKVRPSAPGPQIVPPVRVDEGLHKIKLVRWYNPGGHGAYFYINGQLLGSLNNLPPLLLASSVTHELLINATEENDGLVMRFEDPTLITGTNLVEGSERLVYEPVDTSTTSAQSSQWDQVAGAAHMSLSPQSLAGGGQQLDIDLGSVPHWEHAYLRQDYVNAPLDSYKARFWVDPSLLSIPEGGGMRLVYGCTNSALNWCVDFRLQIHRLNGEFELRLFTWEDDGTMHVVSTPFTPEPHFVEFHYQTGAAPGYATGWAKLWLDGGLIGISDELDNANRKVEDVRFGSNYTHVAVTGILSLDEIETWAN